MFTRGYARHPCTQIACCQGVAVRPIGAYRCEGSTENPCICIIHTKGCYGETLMNICYHLSTSVSLWYISYDKTSWKPVWFL